MKHALIPFGALMLATSAGAQTIDLTPIPKIEAAGGPGSDGDVAWKANNPSTSSDWFNVDFDADLNGAIVTALILDIGSTGPATGPNHTAILADRECLHPLRSTGDPDRCPYGCIAARAALGGVRRSRQGAVGS